MNVETRTRRLSTPIPPSALVLFGIVSVQFGAALAKRLFTEVGSLGTVTLRLFFAAVVLMLVWRPPLRMTRRWDGRELKPLDDELIWMITQMRRLRTPVIVNEEGWGCG